MPFVRVRCNIGPGIGGRTPWSGSRWPSTSWTWCFCCRRCLSNPHFGIPKMPSRSVHERTKTNVSATRSTFSVRKPASSHAVAWVCPRWFAHHWGRVVEDFGKSKPRMLAIWPNVAGIRFYALLFEPVEKRVVFAHFACPVLHRTNRSPPKGNFVRTTAPRATQCQEFLSACAAGWFWWSGYRDDDSPELPRQASSHAGRVHRPFRAWVCNLQHPIAVGRMGRGVVPGDLVELA